MKDYIVSLNFEFNAVTGCIAKNEQEALSKVKKQLNEDIILKALSTIKMNNGYKTKETFNDMTDLKIVECYVEEG